jgi:hypothetical protein
MRTSKADKNYLSWSGDTLQWFLGTDHPKDCPKVPDELLPVCPEDWDSAAKISNNKWPILVKHIVMAQCRENVIDINNKAKNIIFHGVFGREGEVGDQVVTIKGGSGRITLSGVIKSKGRNADLVIGNWSDQSTDKSYDIDLYGLYRLDDQPVSVILARVDRGSVKLPINCKILWCKSLAYTAYWWLKLAAVKAGLFKS